ncbi:unnamed protein product [Oppiella nova]|uniref:RING-type domain-containing protein n=1 Tax=Oppiella nova TaxID=334625 RepID=A0A7R9LHV8_9ACAR|nr:unnamed protein product [Oppiella nova]CAG2163734.1 unnamed protein product [Oppiella nova]
MPGIDRSRVVGVSDEELDQFICGICLEVFVNPVVTQCCQQSYCSECIQWWLSDHNTCPNDRTQLGREGIGPAPRFVINLLNNMKVKCDFYVNGCQSVVKLSELAQHVRDCDYDESRRCRTCHFTIDSDCQHNCVDNLLVMNQSLRDENERLKAENKLLSMSGVIESTRSGLGNCVMTRQMAMSSPELIPQEARPSRCPYPGWIV